MSIRSLGLPAALAVFLGTVSLAQAAGLTEAAPPSVAAGAVGRWLHDPQGRIIGSVRSLSPDGQTAEIMIGAFFQPGSHIATVPADALTVTNGRVTLRTGTAMALDGRR